MPFFGKGNGKGIDYKNRLEHKLYLARENPDLVFDLSDCDLKSVPSGVYSLCKVFRKESLLLQKNNLSSLSGGGAFEDLTLIKIIDLRSNSLTSLPNDIRHLKSLEELYLNNNLLKGLPDSIGELSNLRVLSCPFNKLKKLPESLGQLVRLEKLLLQGNPALCVLPDLLCRAANLSQLILDPGRYTHPPNDVVLQGTREVMRFLSHQIGEEYKDPCLEEACVTKDSDTHHDKQMTLQQMRDLEIQEKLEKLEKRKDEKLKERLAVEKGIAEQKEKEFMLQNIIKVGKDKLMEDLMKQQSKIAEEVMRFQNKKEAERAKLIEELQKVEKSADRVISQMLALNNSVREPSHVLHQQELDKIAQERLFAKHSVELRRKEVINAMESLLAEERLHREKMRKYEQLKAEVVKNTLNRDVEWDEEINALVCWRNAQQSAVVAAATEDERSQMAAVAALLERSDLESVRLRTQLRIIEQHLAALTALELQRNNLNMHQLQCDLSEKRTALSYLLVEVLNQQNSRKKHLLQTLRKMEEHKLTEFEDSNSAEDYWLRQYQKLLDSSPQGLLQQQGLDIKLVHHLVTRGVVHCLPFLARCNLEKLSNEYLIQVGLTNEEDRANLLKAVESYLSDSSDELVRPVASAPPPDHIPSAPIVTTPDTECVVCLHASCEIIFLPCGHLCCCWQCSEKLGDCPLCRSFLERKIRIIPA